MDRHVELRFNLGNGPVVLRSLQPIRLGHWHRIVAQRYRQDGWLRLDDDEDVATTSPGTHSTLELGTNTFLGTVPPHLATSRTFENIGTASGFVGCMRRVKISRRPVHFGVPPEGRVTGRRRRGRHYDSKKRGRDNVIETSKLSGGSRRRPKGEKESAVGREAIGVTTVIRMNGITQCGENPCWKVPCANDATCVWKSGLNFTCICKQGFMGKDLLFFFFSFFFFFFFWIRIEFDNLLYIKL